MRILCLSPYPERISGALVGAGDGVKVSTDTLTIESARGFDWLVSYGYRHILRQPVLDLFPRRAINLHIAFLPYNRGAHPNYWSWAERTPSGVTIHEIDAGVDTGPIIAQRMVCMSRERTFADTYAQLQDEIEVLFAQSWPVIRTGDFVSTPQAGPGTSHRVRDLPTWDGGWGARICDAVG